MLIFYIDWMSCVIWKWNNRLSTKVRFIVRQRRSLLSQLLVRNPVEKHSFSTSSSKPTQEVPRYFNFYFSFFFPISFMISFAVFLPSLEKVKSMRILSLCGANRSMMPQAIVKSTSLVMRLFHFEMGYMFFRLQPNFNCLLFIYWWLDIQSDWEESNPLREKLFFF